MSHGLSRPWLVLAAGVLLAPVVARPGPVPGHGVAPGASVAVAQSGAELTLVGQLGGDVRAVAWMGDRVVIGIGPRVAVVDIADPTAPRVIGQTGILRGTVIDLSVDGLIGYAIAGGLSVVDLTDPTAPREIGFVEVGRHDSLYGWNGPARMAVGDGVVALTGDSVSRQGRPAFVDVRDPRRPLLASQLKTYVGLDVAMDGQIAYLAVDADELGQANPSVVVMDVRDPASPREIGHAGTHGSAWRLALTGSRLVVLGGECPLTILDVTEPTAPTVARCGNPFGDGGWWPEGAGLDMEVEGDTVVLVDDYGSVWLVDVSGVEMRPVGYVEGVPGGTQAFGAMSAGGHAGSSIEIAAYAVAVRRGQVLFAGGPYGLSVLDARDLGDPRTLGSLDVLEDADTRPIAPALAAGGHLAFVAAPGVTVPRVEVVEIADPANPHVVGMIPFAARQAAPMGEDHVVLSDGAQPQSTLRIYDVSAPALPVPVGALSIAGPSQAVVVDGAYAYAVGGSRLTAVDLRDPSRPAIARELVLDGGASDVVVAGGYAYAVSSSALHVIDVHDPAAPAMIARVNARLSDPVHVAVDGSRVFVGARWRLTAFDVRDPAAPTELWHMAVHSPPIAPIARLVAEDGRLYAATSEGGLWVFDVRGDVATVLFIVPACAATVDVARAGDVVVVLDEYTSEGAGDDARGLRLRLLDLADAPAIRVLGGYRPSSAFRDAVVEGDIAYLAGATTGLHVVDVSDPAAPREVATLPVRGGVRQLVKAGSFLYGVTLRYGDEVHGAFVHRDNETRLCFVTVFNVSDPLHPRLVSEVARPEIRDVAVASGRLYLADAGGLSVLDIATDPAQPRDVGDIGSSRSGRGYEQVAVAGMHAFVVRAAGLDASRRPEPPALRVIDVAEPTRPSVAGEVVVGDVETLVRDLTVSGDHAYLAVLRLPALTGGLDVVDVHRPDAPLVVGGWEPFEAGLTVVPIEPNAVAVAGRYAFLGTYGGLRVLDVIVPGYPVEVARLDTLEESLYDWLGIVPGQNVVEGDDGHLYLPRGDAGLLVLGAMLPPRPTPTSGPSPTRTASATPRPTLTPLPSPTATVTPIPPTRGPTPTRTATATFVARTPTATSPLGTPSPTATGPTPTPDGTRLPTATGPTPTPDGTPSPTATGPTPTPYGTRLPTATGATPTSDGTPVYGTPTPTTFATAGPSPTGGAPATASRTLTPEGTPAGTQTVRPTDTAPIWLPVVTRSH